MMKGIRIVAGMIMSMGLAFAAPNPAAIWQASFSDVMPNHAGVTQAYCVAHSPDKFRTTVPNILKHRVLAHNGVSVKYKNYDQRKKNGLYFIEVHAVLSGQDAGGQWQQDMYIHEQKLSPKGKTFSVWQTAKCKGFFTGTIAN